MVTRGSPKAAKGRQGRREAFKARLLPNGRHWPRRRGALKPLFKRPANGQSRALGSPKAAKRAGKGDGKQSEATA